MKSFFLAFLLLSVSLHAQKSTDQIKLDELKTPSSPGFTILGVQPTEISRPKSWRELETNLTNSFFQDNKFVIPKNIAVEFNPFFTLREINPSNSPSFIYGRKDNGFNWNTLRINSSFSLATGDFKTYNDTSKTNPRMGLGYRTQLAEFKPTSKGRYAFRALLATQLNILTVTTALQQLQVTGKNKFKSADSLISTLKKSCAESLKSSNHLADTGVVNAMIEQNLREIAVQMYAEGKSNTEIFTQLNAAMIAITEQADFMSNYNQVVESLTQRYGLCVEMAAAMLLDFPGNDITFSKVPKFGIWFTGTYRTENGHFEVGGLARFLSSKFDTLSRFNNFDFGGRVMIEGERWSINAELIQRFQWEVIGASSSGSSGQVTLKYNADFKTSLTANYRLTQDMLLTYTFGNDFTINTETQQQQSSLGSRLGITYAFGGPRVQDVKDGLR
ncbi:MAG: hypothetical protein IM638_04425 [Bacteroidetes bacterium]|nr:hypothetical protein [Bacteroidota bacterium]